MSGIEATAVPLGGLRRGICFVCRYPALAQEGEVAIWGMKYISQETFSTQTGWKEKDYSHT